MAKGNDTFKSSVIVTGTHYSMSTLVGQIIGKSPSFNVVHEPLNYQPTLGYNSIHTENWYQYFDNSKYSELREKLIGFSNGHRFFSQSLTRLWKVRSLHDFLRVGKYFFTNLKIFIYRKPAVYKDPFLVFSSKELQENDNLKVVLCIRHPCAFAESIKRRGGGFDFNNIKNQEYLLKLLSQSDRELIEEFTEDKKTLVEQAALLWRIVYGFSFRYYAENANTFVLKQEDLAANSKIIDEVFDFVGCNRTTKVNDFLESHLNSNSNEDMTKGRSGYIKRDVKKTADKWKSRLSKEEISIIQKIVKSVATQYNYEF
ncbi:hypothetical protein ACFOEW_00235 [Alteromonas oceani]|uniref:Sulfotransferase domain-containing protein n=1 Tax=Alteromonas oceani TaxID=2071609 RepID=A0ABV7JTI2_9ALTE|nr:hypothetical protein [Alteromonas oceani]